MIIRVTVPRPESNQPETSVHRLEKLGAVSTGESHCSSSWNPGARSTASLLAKREWVLKSTHFDGGSPLFRGQFQPDKSALKNCKSRTRTLWNKSAATQMRRPAPLKTSAFWGSPKWTFARPHPRAGLWRAFSNDSPPTRRWPRRRLGSRGAAPGAVPRRPHRRLSA